MPSSSGVPVADLSGRLDGLLLASLGVLVVLGLLAALLVRHRAQQGLALPGPVRGLLVHDAIEPVGRRVLRTGLGVLWIVDGLLQAQPQMPGGFGRDVLVPGLAEGPSWLRGLPGRSPVPGPGTRCWPTLRRCGSRSASVCS